MLQRHGVVRCTHGSFRCISATCTYFVYYFPRLVCWHTPTHSRHFPAPPSPHPPLSSGQVYEFKLAYQAYIGVEIPPPVEEKKPEEEEEVAALSPGETKKSAEEEDENKLGDFAGGDLPPSDEIPASNSGKYFKSGLKLGWLTRSKFDGVTELKFEDMYHAAEARINMFVEMAVRDDDPSQRRS